MGILKRRGLTTLGNCERPPIRVSRAERAGPESVGVHSAQVSSGLWAATSSLPVFDASYEVQSAIRHRRPLPTSCPALRLRTSIRLRAPRRGASVHTVDLVFRLAESWVARIETQRPESISPLPPEALSESEHKHT
ncbi:hypothetical protein TYRP_023031 [Tyrophagus putrescentiae]|nr:hypothetical protein TYRP_023031 [Tyrophagus putrescentiae]